MKPITLALAALPAMLLLALTMATESAAILAHYPGEFGAGFPVLGIRAYPPWSFLIWYGRYARICPRLFDLASLSGLAVIVLPCLLAAGVSGRFIARLKPFGVRAWGDQSDATAAGLIRPDGQITGRVLGRIGRKILSYQGVEHAIIIGASRSGKGVSHVVPTLLSWPSSVLVYDRKGELWHITADHRRQFSHAFYFSPTDPNTARFNPLFEVRKGPMEVADVQNIVGILVDPTGRKDGALDFWDQSAANFFTGLILHVLYTAPDHQKTLAEVRQRMVDIEPTLDAMLETKHRFRADVTKQGGLARSADGALIQETHPEVWLGATAIRNMEDRVRSSVIATAQKSLAPWADPLVAHATSWSDFRLGDLVCAEAPVSLYLITPQAHADRLAFLIRVMLRQTLGSLMETIDEDGLGRRKRHHLLMMLDEFPKLGSLPFLENALGEMAGYGVTAHLICQSFNDVFRHYGVHTSLFDNVHITAAFATSEPSSIEKIVKRAGKSLEMRESYSDPRHAFGRGHRSRSQHEVERYILGEHDVRALSANKQFLFVNGVRPIIADKLRYYTHPQLKRLARNFHHGERALLQQRPGVLDAPPGKGVDWIGVTAVEAYEPPLPTVSKPASLPLTVEVLEVAVDID